MGQGTFEPLSLVALESIDFQVKDKTVKELVIILEDFRRDLVEGPESKTTEVIKSYGQLIESTLRKRFNLKKLEFVVSLSDEIDAFGNSPDITKGSVLYKAYSGQAGKAVDGQVALEKVGSALGYIDLKEGKAEGVLSDFPCTVGISLGLLKCTELSPVHIVAQIFHEVGHILTYMETLAYTFSTCLILADTMSRLDKSKGDAERIKIFRDLETKTGVEINNQEILIEEGNEQVAAVNIFKDFAESKNSEFGSSIYDLRSWEALSDQFCARMGLTVPLAESLDIIYRRTGIDGNSYKSKFRMWLFTIFEFVSIIFLTIVCPVLGGFLIILELLLITISPFDRTYDKPGERIQRLRNELNAESKNPNLTKEDRQRIDKDVGLINRIASRIEDKETHVDKIWLLFSADARDQKKRRLLLQDLQSLTNNNLFANANALKILKEVK